jgi:RNA polymerase sigma-70 factor (ECF subfamily)
MRLDDDAFCAWVEETYGASCRLARRIVGHEADAADVVQESYVRAYTALRDGAFRSDRAALASWLRRIVTRASLDALRARHRRREAGDEGLDVVATSSPSPSAPVDRRDLERAIQDLPTEQRAAFVLRELEGLTLKETAAELGCTEGAVEQRVLRAWAGLKRRLRDEPR